MLTLRQSDSRGFANHGWLKSYHSFSFADYFDPKNMGFGALRVINEDYIAAGTGFGKHPHQDMEIITYVISGSLSHEDSMGNSSVIRPGEVQIMSAGTGVFHSEQNHSQQETHLLQIWIKPDKKGIAPRYEQKSFADDFKNNELKLVVSKSKRDGSLLINQDVEIFVGKLLAGKEYNFVAKDRRKIWIQLINGELIINSQTLINGDAIAVENEKAIHLKASKNCEFLLFDLE